MSPFSLPRASCGLRRWKPTGSRSSFVPARANFASGWASPPRWIVGPRGTTSGRPKSPISKRDAATWPPKTRSSWMSDKPSKAVDLPVVRRPWKAIVHLETEEPEKVAGTTTCCAASIEQTTVSCVCEDFFNRSGDFLGHCVELPSDRLVHNARSKCRFPVSRKGSR